MSSSFAEPEHAPKGILVRRSLNDDEKPPRVDSSFSDRNSSANRSTNSLASSSSCTSTSERANGIARKETLAVNSSKFLLYVVLILTAAAIGAGTYVLLSTFEKEKFHVEFVAYSAEIAKVADSNAHSIFGQMHSLSTALTSYALNDNLTWPFCTFPHFDLRAAESEHLSGAELILLAPVVTKEESNMVKEWDKESLTPIFIDGNALAWENYTWHHQEWIEEDLKYRGKSNVEPGPIPQTMYEWPPEDYEKEILKKRRFAKYEHIHVPIWQLSPVPTNASIVNLDLETHPSFLRMFDDVLEIEHVLLSEVVNDSFIKQTAYGNEQDDGHPRSFVVQPVFDDFLTVHNRPHVVAFLVAVLPWEPIFANVLPTGVNGVVVDIKDTCGMSEFTYIINGHHAEYFGQGDLHDPKYEYLLQTYEFAEEARFDGDDDDLLGLHCEYQLRIFASATFEAPFHTNKPGIYTAVIVLVFLFTMIVFMLYDYFVKKRQDRVMNIAKRTTAIVKSLFPKNVQKRILEEAQQQAELETQTKRKVSIFTPKHQLKEFLKDDPPENGDSDAAAIFKSKPIADYFQEATIMFADLVGFTAWSSMREPAQVFTLLETIYQSFDEIAKRRRVFKVETVGDCYVAVAGLPTPRKDHAIAMARFSRDCLYKMTNLTRQLEVTLGPDTAELGLRFGLHSGPVTAGVLRGERSRFQLFGDTVNMTAKIEATGAKNKIHLSKETARHLKQSGKSHWLSLRETKAVVHGDGEIESYWLSLKSESTHSETSGTSERDVQQDFSLRSESQASSRMLDTSGHRCCDDSVDLTLVEAAVPKSLSSKEQRLVNWVQDVLASFLKEIVARREASGLVADSAEHMREVEQTSNEHSESDQVLDEVANIITLPNFDAEASLGQRPASEIVLEEDVVEQLGTFLTEIAAAYREKNPFHNFEHASHVTMSVVKLLARIVAPEIDGEMEEDHVASTLHDHTYGITSAPLTKFAAVFSALIHDADHPGVPNTQLVREETHLAAVYKGKSIAEQNSVDIAWKLLMEPRFEQLRRTIYATESEFNLFRQLVVNIVMATDIMDKDLGALRKGRWERAFAGPPDDDNIVAVNRKATIVIEHLIQASDVAHTMQHWHIYRKWNARLFQELYRAYVEGRAEKNPADFWFKGEISFLDFYVIPLAKKLKECGVFGVSSDEYLDYATNNRQEWELKGEDIVAELHEAARLKHLHDAVKERRQDEP